VQALAPDDLARRCQHTLPDDTRAFEQLVTHYKQRVFAMAYRLMGDRQDAEDQAQEVFLKIYRNIKHLDEPATITAWVDRITVRTCLDALDKRKRRPRIQPLVMQDEPDAEPRYADERTPTPEEAALRRELQRCLERTLAELDDAGRAAIVLRDIEDRPYNEIGEALGIGLSAVKMRIHRARIAFQQALERICPGTWRLETGG
jgi:RNA polymerase sigma-70 factor, ECF subfamily